MFLLLSSLANCIVDEMIIEDGSSGLTANTRYTEMFKNDENQSKVVYPTLSNIYRVDIQTKLILLVIMVSLLALVFSTTVKMLKEVSGLKIKKNIRKNVDQI